MFLSTFSRKLYEHLNIFIRIGHVSWHLLNIFLDIFVTILLFFISTKPSKNIKPNKTFNFYYFQTLTKSSKPSQIQSNPQLQTSKLCYSQTQIKPKSLNPNQILNQHFQTPNLSNVKLQ
jgi:hypothetical protein